MSTINITVIGNNESSITVALDAINEQGRAVTYADVCANPCVIDFFGDVDADFLKENLLAINDNEVPDGFRNAILGATVEPNAVLEFDAEGEETDDEEETTTQASTAGRHGTATVYLDGGLRSANIDVVAGVTSLYDVVHNGAIRALTGLNDTQLTSYSVLLNEQPVTATMLNTVKVKPGDEITLNATAVHPKG